MLENHVSAWSGHCVLLLLVMMVPFSDCLVVSFVAGKKCAPIDVWAPPPLPLRLPPFFASSLTFPPLLLLLIFSAQGRWCSMSLQTSSFWFLSLWYFYERFYIFLVLDLFNFFDFVTIASVSDISMTNWHASFRCSLGLFCNKDNECCEYLYIWTIYAYL